MKEFDKPLRTSPFIKLLRSPHSGYFYDVNRNEIIPIDDDVYTYLDKLLKDGIEDGAEATLEKVAELKENGYLSNNRVKEIKHPMTDYIEDILERNVRQLVLQITQNCNFRCSYCPYSQEIGLNRTHSSKRMSLDIALKSILFLKEHSVDVELIYIGFYGGEPLLEFEMIKKLVIYAEDIFEGRDLRFTLTTNLSLITDEMIIFFMKHNFYIIVSLDGYKEIHDNNRTFAKDGSGTFDFIMEKLQYIHDNHFDFFQLITIHSVITPTVDLDKLNYIMSNSPVLSTCHKTSSIVDYYFSEKENIFNYQYIYQITYSEFLADLALFNRVNENKIPGICKENISRFYSDMEKMIPIAKLNTKLSPGGPCIPGESRIMITVDGDILPCERVSETTNANYIGNIFTGFNYESVNKIINIASLTAENCVNCWAFTKCNVCVKKADNGKILSGTHKLKSCFESKSNAYYKLAEFIMFEEVKHIYKIGGDLNE